MKFAQRLFVYALIVLAALLISGNLGINYAARRSETENVRQQLLGTWLLVSIQNDQHVKMLGEHPLGMLAFDAAGRFTSQVMRSDLRKFASGDRTKATPEESQAVVRGSMSLFGTFTVTSPDTVSLHIEGSSFPNWNGVDQTRGVVLQGDRLELTNRSNSFGQTSVHAFWKRASAETSSAAAEGAQVPKFEVDPFWPKPFKDPWISGEVGGTCVDQNDHVFILARNNLTLDEQRNSEPAPPVIELDPQGNVVNTWGNGTVRDATGIALTAGVKDSFPRRLHGCTVDPEGNVWIGGNMDGMIQKYSHDGSKLLLQIGAPGRLDTSDGTVNGYAMNSSHTALNRPASIAIDPTNGDIYVADGYGNRRVVVFDREGHFLRQWGRQATVAETEAGVGGVFLDTVHCVAIDKDGLVYVCDRKGDRVEVFDKAGNFKKNIWIQKGTGFVRGMDGSAWYVAFSPDSAQKYMYVADGSNEVLWILDHATGEILSGFGRPGHMAGNFSYLHTIAVDSKGSIIAGEVINGRRVQKFNVAGYEAAGTLPPVRHADSNLR
jgi:DNA-binding beta-propeller fold protein YncE